MNSVKGICVDSEALGKDYPGTCLSCGLLGFTRPPAYNDPISRVQELSADRRWYGNRLTHVARLYCFEKMARIQAEVDEEEEQIRATDSFKPESEEDTERAQAMRAVFTRPRPKCTDQGAWYQYVDFLDPKWHFEDRRTMELERLRQEQAKMIANMQKEQSVTAAEHAKTAEAHKRLFELSDRKNTLFWWAFIVLAVISLIVALGNLPFLS